ncbi:DUF3618 domain-containing protein [Aquicoccus sp. SCR17]|nr:DUF3618 domain-containing protein [Carideicomes alvinocaridis]
MTYSDVKTPEEIEREIEAQRGELRRTMGEVNERFSTDGMIRGVAESLAHNGAELGESVGRVVRRNPAAVALTAAGLAWLGYSLSRSSGPQRISGPDYYAAAGGTGAAQAAGSSEGGSPWIGKARDRAREGAARVGTKAGELRHSAEGRYERGKAKARAYSTRAKVSAHELRSRIADGTSEMSEEARKRVIKAREQAYEARVKAEYYARKSGQKAQGFYDDQPLVAGALALAVGAAIGGVLPRTRREDETFGAWSDQLFDEAERVYREERAKLEEVARETGREAESQAKSVMEDIRRDAESTMEDAEKKGKEAADKVRSTAKSAADKENLGSGTKSTH